MVLIAEQGRSSRCCLAVGEQVGAGVQGVAGAVERVGAAAAVAVQVLLDPTPAAVQSVAGEADDVEGVHHRDRVRAAPRLVAVLNPVKPSIATTSTPVAPGLVPFGQPGLECLLWSGPR